MRGCTGYTFSSPLYLNWFTGRIALPIRSFFLEVSTLHGGGQTMTHVCRIFMCEDWLKRAAHAVSSLWLRGQRLLRMRFRFWASTAREFKFSGPIRRLRHVYVSSGAELGFCYRITMASMNRVVWCIFGVMLGDRPYQTHAEIAGLKGSLLLIFARLVRTSLPHVEQFIDLLVSIPT
ncbi:hypothetical protein PHJA_001673900 [Phtheirospermum japonicum]|uniref:Uncharacterized protein n=1 Tax=Phtheirospermum japonicum TaxID=374723 RepID=A0A830C830_9LAMI|nr:hypothetical protein PHJA_001673900 [Phtheirospermum japonicum]